MTTLNFVSEKGMTKKLYVETLSSSNNVNPQ